MEYRPSARNSILEAAVVAGLAFVAVPLLLWLLRGVDSHVFLLVFGLASGVAAFLFYSLRYFLHAPRVVRVSDEGLRVDRRAGRVDALAWSDVARANHRSSYGLRWSFGVKTGEVVLRDDGFSVAQWNDLSSAIERHLAAAKVPVERDGLAGKFSE